MMDKEMSLIKSPDLINLNDTDTDAEIQYKSLDATNGDATVDTDEPRLSGDSPSASSPASDSPKPPRQGHVHWQTANSDEHRQLLATEGESSDRHSSDDEVDVWAVTGEQRQYYVQQFTSLEPDLTALIPGHTAKAFFEKSKLPITALSKIWNLSDVTRDGCLCLEEFVTAMHLVVLRRNRIEVPDQLPPQLVPKVLASATAASRPSEASQPAVTVPVAPAPAPAPAAAPAAAPAPVTGQLTSPKGKEWTKFVESPMSNISSPGIKPVNFDFHKSAVEQNPQILHPVAVKGIRDEPPGRRPAPADSDSELSDAPEPAAAAAIQPPQPPPPPAALAVRPAARKALRHCSSGPTGGAGDASSSGPTSLPVLAQTAPALPCRLPQPPPPPPPPPRPGHASHGRSSSLDLSCVPPMVPPRSSPADAAAAAAARGQPRPVPAAADPSAGFADFSQFQEPAPELARARQGAFEVYKKPAAAAAAGGPSPAGSRHCSGGDPAAEKRPSRPHPHAHLQSPAISPARLAKMVPQELLAVSSWSRESLLVVLRAQRERTATLAAVTAELNQELAETVEERTSLELQLDHMRPDND